MRLANIIAAYQRDGWNVRAVCVYPEEGYPKHSDSHSIKFPQNSPFRLFGGQRVPFIDDLLTGDFATSEEIWERLLAIMPDTIDAVHVEQPWLWPVAVKLRELPAYRDAALVYGAANIEAELKRDILRSYSSEETARALAAIDDLERFAARTAETRPVRRPSTAAPHPGFRSR